MPSFYLPRSMLSDLQELMIVELPVIRPAYKLFEYPPSDIYFDLRYTASVVAPVFLDLDGTRLDLTRWVSLRQDQVEKP